MRIGYAIICEEHPPERIIAHARAAEEAGFDYLSISDHFHPWMDVQGESPFAWSVIGALSEATDLPVITQVTCPIRRYHPAIVAQAAATSARMCRGGFTLGLGSGEALNEHVVGGEWPNPDHRLAMLDEATHIIQTLWSGEMVSFRGEFYTVDRARLYTLPDERPGIAIAASGPDSAGLAASYGGLVATGPSDELVSSYREQGGEGRIWGQATLCFDRDPEEAAERFVSRWRHSALDWTVNGELPTPAGFETATEKLDREDIITSEPVGDDVEAIVGSLQQYADAGFDAVALHNIGEDHQPFLTFAGEELLPESRARLAA